MTEWRSLKMAEVMAAFYDGPHATPCPADDGPVYLGIKNITDAGLLDLTDVRHIAEEDFGRWTKRVTPQPGDIVFTYEATLHRYALIPDGFRGCLGRRLALVRPDRSVVDPRFLYFAMLGPEWRATVTERVISGSTVDRVPILTFPEFPISVPPLDVQERIAEVLGSIDDLIENNRRRVEVLEEMARAIYREWFVRFRYLGHEDVPLVDSRLGPIPGDWELFSIGDVLELRYGKALTKDNRRGGPVAVVSSAGVVGWHDEALVQGPTIVLGRKGNVGSVNWVECDSWPIDTAYFVVSELPLRYVVEQLRGTKFLNSHAAVPGLSRDQAYSRPFLRPTARLMKEFDVISGVLAAEARTLTEASQRLGDLRALLLPRLVTGRIGLSSLGLDAVLEGAS